MNPRIDFWRESHSWPRDNASFVFLARALHLFGRAMFEDSWTGEEPQIELYQNLPANPPHGSSGAAYFANSLLMQHRPDLNRESPRWAGDRVRGYISIPPAVLFTKDEWTLALSLVKDNHEKHGPALLRLYQVKNRIVELAESGQLITAVRPVAGGDPVSIPRDWWNTERTNSRFDFCKMNPKKPFDLGSAGDNYGWIYVERGSLRVLLDQLAAGSGTSAPNVPVQTVQENSLSAGSARTSSSQRRASQRQIGDAVDDLVKNNPSATMRQADELAATIGASRDAVREELRKTRLKTGSTIRPGRPRKERTP